MGKILTKSRIESGILDAEIQHIENGNRIKWIKCAGDQNMKPNYQAPRDCESKFTEPPNSPKI